MSWPVTAVADAVLRQWVCLIWRWLSALQLHAEFLDLGAVLAAEPRHAEERGFHPDFFQHGGNFLVGGVLGAEQEHATLVLVEDAAPGLSGIE